MIAIEWKKNRNAVTGNFHPSFLPWVERISETEVIPDTVRSSVMTMYATIVGIAGTKYRARIRRRDGTPTLDTVAGISTLRATWHARSNLLQSDTTILATNDSWLDEGTPGSNFRFNSVILSAKGPGNRNSPVLEFDVSALTGLTWKSAKLRLTYDGSDSVGDGSMLIRRVLQDMETNDSSWSYYDTSETDAWQSAGALGPLDADQTTQVTWPVANGTASGTTILSPDITDMVEDAIENQSGILKVVLNRTSGGAHQFHSLEAVTGSANKPAIIFEAF